MSATRPARIIAAVSPLLPLVAGLVVLAIGLVGRRSLGPRYRVGTLLSAAPVVSVAEARALADGPPRYVQIAGRVDSETDFEDDAHRPLVFRRTRLQLRDGSRWVDVDDGRERVPFEVREGLDSIAIDDGALDEGLVVVVRESVGTAADALDRVPEGTAPATPLRLRIEQVSTVEHAVVAGVPGKDEAGTVRMSAGLGRPLIMATMDRADAMRVLAEGQRFWPLVLAATMVAGVVLVAVGLLWAILGALTAETLAASPSPSGGTVGDPRSSGQGPGLVGDPLFALLVVVAIGLGALVLTLGYIRLTGRRST
jgi:hypothetical protein